MKKFEIELPDYLDFKENDPIWISSGDGTYKNIGLRLKEVKEEKAPVIDIPASLIPEGYEIDYFFSCNANCNIGEDVIYQFYPAQKHVGPFYYSKYPSGGIPIAKLKKKTKTYRPFKLSDLTADCKDWWIKENKRNEISLFAYFDMSLYSFVELFNNFKLCKNPKGTMDTWVWETCGVEE